MAVAFQVTIDCADPGGLAPFWAQALGYEIPDPPGDFDTWPEFLRAQGAPEKHMNAASAIEDPDGVGPRVYFQQVPEGKAAKNRVHLDLRSVAPDFAGDERMAALESESERLVVAGATRLNRIEPAPPERGWIVMADPEGNEFCLS